MSRLRHDGQLTTARLCSKCYAPLTIVEMHYYDNGNGTATCEKCEGAWMEEVAKFRRGERDTFPFREEPTQ